MKETIEALIVRDGLSHEEAVSQVKRFFLEMCEDIRGGGSPWTWENEFVQEFGLEPDYFEDFIFRV